MNAVNNTKLAAKKAAGINIHLYSDDHPETTVEGTGFKDAEKARRTIELVRHKPRNRQVWTINAMYYRAKHHPHQTPAMRDAMSVFQRWLEEYNQEWRKTNKGRKCDKTDATDAKKSNKKRERKEGNTENVTCEDGDDVTTPNTKAPRVHSPSRLLSAPSSPSRRSVLESAYKTLFNATLPKVARAEHWPIHWNHCLMRVALDAYWQCCWYDRLDRKKGALASMTVPQIENLLAVGERMATEGKAYVARLNRESLGYRGKRGLGGAGGGAGAQGTRLAEGRSSNQHKLNFAAVDDSAVDPGLAMATVKEKDDASAKGGDRTDASSVRSGDKDSPGNEKHHNDTANKGALLLVQRAVTDRASCRGCKEKIGKGEYRVGMQTWSSGREVTVWRHPRCFVGDAGVVRVEKLKRGTSARCKYTGSGFAAGDVRLVLEAGAAKRYYDALSAVGPLLAPVYDVLQPVAVPPANGEERARTTAVARGSDIRGLDQLDEDDREAILAALCPATP